MKLRWQDLAIRTALLIVLATFIGGAGLAIYYDEPRWLILSAIALAVIMAG